MYYFEWPIIFYNLLRQPQHRVRRILLSCDYYLEHKFRHSDGRRHNFPSPLSFFELQLLLYKKQTASKMLGPINKRRTTHYKGNLPNTKLHKLCQARFPKFTLFFNQAKVWNLIKYTTVSTANLMDPKISSFQANYINQSVAKHIEYKAFLS